MLIFMVFLIFCKVTNVTNKNAGSTIFHRHKLNATCWSKDDIAKLRARKEFEHMIPPSVNPEKISKLYIDEMLKYFNTAFTLVHKTADNHTAELLSEALCDTIGGHLTSEILPSVRFAYYAGYIPYRSARQMHDYLDNIKIKLNTQGVGWKHPPKVAWSKWSHLTVSKISIGSGKGIDPCASLITKRDYNQCIHLPSPTLDDNNEPSAIALPFKHNGLISLLTPNSENSLLKYYTTATRCILHSSPSNCRHADFVNLNNGLWHWMKRDVAPHLVDEKLFAAYGGILRIAAAVQSYGKGLTRRNLFDYQKAPGAKWQPWKSMMNSYLYVNLDWTPTVYVLLVILTAISICVLQACYNYMFGMINTCNCRSRPYRSSNIAYSKMDSNFPAVLSNRSTSFLDKDKDRLNTSNSRPSSMTSTTHKVYDLNDNTEKIMSISMSGHGNRDAESTSSKMDTDEECLRRPKVTHSETRAKSPPKIETSIAQLTIGKQKSSQSKNVARPMYSTSTLTRSDMMFCQDQRLSDSAWSLSTSSTSCKSATSISSKSRSQKTRRSRDLAWARHVISRHSQKSGQFSSTELDGHSIVTPLARR